jgi:hypothetical protein
MADDRTFSEMQASLDALRGKPAGAVTFDDYMENWLAKPRYKGDHIAKETQDEMAASKAAIAALRNYPRNASLVQDSTAPIHFEQDLGPGTLGSYTPSEGKIRMVARRPWAQDEMQITGYHETLHDLQHKGGYPVGADRKPASNSPTSTLGLGRNWYKSDEPALPGYEGSPQDFYKAIEKNGMAYGANEPAAWMAASLNQPNVKMDSQVRKVASQFPGLSGMYAQQVSQPNRPTPKHYKGYPEMSWIDQKLFDLQGGDPAVMMGLGGGLEVPPEARYNAQQEQVLRRLNEETNPRDRH